MASNLNTELKHVQLCFSHALCKMPKAKENRCLCCQKIKRLLVSWFSEPLGHMSQYAIQKQAACFVGDVSFSQGMEHRQKGGADGGRRKREGSQGQNHCHALAQELPIQCQL